MTSEPRPTAELDVGELRERLRALGYLNASVDRFVLAPAGQERSAPGLAWLVSLRIGLIAALLLGPAAAAGVAVRLPDLISGPRDAVVVALYLAVIFGGVTTLVFFGAATIVRVLGRRADPRAARRVGLASGIVVALACLAYLTLWWNATGSVWIAPGRTLLALGAAVVISLLLGHAVTIAALALLARETGAVTRAPALSWRALIGLGAAAFLGATALLALSVVRAGDAPSRPSAFAVVPTGVRVVVAAIDGFDPSLFDEVKRVHPIETLVSLLANPQVTGGGVEDSDPARVWTTVATGVRPEEHGVTGLELRRIAGVEGTVERAGESSLGGAMSAVTDLLRLTHPAAASGRTRRHKMFWEVAADSGLDAVVVNWWATWPATNTRATVISDRAPLRLERGGPQGGEIAPESLYEPLRAAWPGLVQRARALAAGAAEGLAPGEVRDLLLRSATLDAEQVLIARYATDMAPDVLAVYLPGLDIAQHALLQAPRARALAPSALAARVEALRRYYVFLDRLLGELTDGYAPESTVTVVVTHPGRVGGSARAAVSYTGGPVGGVASVRPAPLVDVAPTVLYLLGLPVSRGLAGEAQVGLVGEEFRRKYPLRTVEAYGPYAADVPLTESAPLDREMIERLRSLGYIQ